MAALVPTQDTPREELWHWDTDELQEIEWLDAARLKKEMASD